MFGRPGREAANTIAARRPRGGMTRPRRSESERHDAKDRHGALRTLMFAYIARRMLLMIPTLFGIMLISFVIVQFAPGRAGRARARAVAGQRHLGDVAHRRRRRRRLRRRRAARSRAAARPRRPPSIAARRASTPPSSSSSRRSSASTSRRSSASAMMLWNYARFDFGKSYFRDVPVLQLIKEKLPVSISLGLWMTLLVLRHLDPARHPQGGEGRLALRHLDLGRRHHRLRDPGLPVRHPADRAVRRGVVLLAVLPACAGLTSENFWQLPWYAQGRWTTLGTSRCRSWRWRWAPSPPRPC